MYERGEREKLRSMGIRSVGFRYNGIPGGQQADGEPFCTRLKLFNLFFFSLLFFPLPHAYTMTDDWSLFGLSWCAFG
jgi:hypothetical protein